MDSRIKRAALAVVAILMVTTLLPTSVFAVSIDLGSSNRSDVYNKLDAAMKVQVLGNTLKKCIGQIASSGREMVGASADNAQKGNIFRKALMNFGINHVDITTALWVEAWTQGATGDDMDGIIWCYQEDGRNVLIRFVEAINEIGGGDNVNMVDLICDGVNPGLMVRKDGWGKTLGECNSFQLPALGGYYKADNAEGYFQDFYTNWYNRKVGENKYLPSYDQLDSFDNVAGYFSYMKDFEKRCSAGTTIHDSNNKQDGDVAIAKFDKIGNTLVIKNQYYHLEDGFNPTWEGTLTGSWQSPKSCISRNGSSVPGLLERISTLQSFGNGIDSRDGGYEDIMIAEFSDACRTTLNENGAELKQKLQDLIDNGTDEEKVDAQAQLDALNKALDGEGSYVKSSGDRDSEGGEIYQCVVDVNVADYATANVDTGANCANSGGANALGWFICPIIEWLGDSAEGVYNDYVEPSLKIEPQLFTGGNEAVRTAWGWFQGIANVLFVILLLAVIFSQLTGFGIDNYGIKKILPRLIVMAILTNLSYLLCLICVDLSNILGNGFQAMFENMKNGLPSPSLTVEDSNASLGAGAMTGLTGVAVLAALVGMVGMIWANPMVVLSLFVSALGIVISIFFLFILLSAREAAIIVLTVLAPVAIVLYVLPNTKTIFDKWWKFFLGLLMVYPIAGLLVGGGDYISNLLLSAGMGRGGFFAALTAMIVGVLPIFLIPTVLRNSFTMLGNLGAKLQGIGQKTGGWTTGKIRNSGAYQNLQAASNMRKARVYGGLGKNGEQNLDEDGRPKDSRTRARRVVGNILSGGTRGRQRSALQYQKMVAEEGSLKAVDGADFMLQTQTANATKELTATGAINDIGGMQSSLEKALRENDRAMIRAITDALTAKGEDGREAVKTAWNNVEKSGGVSDVAAKTFANNIMMNHAADYKNNNRSMFEVAKEINAADANKATEMAAAKQTTDNYLAGNKAKLASKATASTMGNMDDKEFASVFGGGIPAGVSADDAQSIGATAYAALNDQNANIKAERRAQLEQLVQQSGYVPEIQDVRVAGNYADQNGNVYRVRQTLDGKNVDEGGFEVDLGHMNPR